MPDLFRRMRGITLVMLLAGSLLPVPALAGSVVSQPQENTSSLTLRQVLAQTLARSPELEGSALEIQVRQGQAWQAGLRPNPVLALESENLLGGGPYSGTDAAETTLSLTQTIELGGKRPQRRALAAAETTVAQAEQALVRNEVLAAATESFFAVLVAQERLQLAAELLVLAQRVLDTVQERIDAGKAAVTEGLRVRMQVRELEVARTRAEGALLAARHTLALRMGKAAADFDGVAGELAIPAPIPELSDLEGRLENSPPMVQRLAESERNRRELSLERARRIPDVDLGIGARYLRESDDTALVVGLSLPLPLFDRNQGGIAAARSRQAQARTEERSALLRARVALAALWQEMSAARDEAQVLAGDLIPAARQALEAAEFGYRAGKFGILEVLDTQRMLVETGERHLQTVAAYHRAATELQRLLGNPLHDVDQAVSFSATVKE